MNIWLTELEKLVIEIKGKEQRTQKDLSSLQRKFGPSIQIELDKLKEQARLMEQKLDNAMMRGSKVQVTQLNLSGASSLPVGRHFSLHSVFFTLFRCT